MVSANLECLILPHQETNLLILLMLEQLDEPKAALLPFLIVVVEAIQFALAA